MKYLIFTKRTCPYCIKAEALLEEKEVVFKAVNFDENQDILLQEIKEAYGWPTVPMVFKIDENHIEFLGGYTDLVKHFGNE